MHNPNLIPTLLKDTSINKGMIYRKLKEALPCRIGIEFELAGDFVQKFCEEYKIIPDKNTDLKKVLSQFYNVLEVKGDSGYSDISIVNTNTISSISEAVDAISSRVADRTRTAALSYTNNYGEPLVTPADVDAINTLLAKKDVPIYEIRISLSDYKQLKGLYKFSQDLVRFCKLHEGGGIHIHIDMSVFDYAGTPKEKEVQYYIKHRLDDIGKLFPKYKGKYNKKTVGLRQKGTWVNLSRLGTLEFRTMPLTFDYSTLMEWIVKIVKFRQDVIHYCKLKPTDKASKQKTMTSNSYPNDGWEAIAVNDTSNYASYRWGSTGRPLNSSSYTGT